jgi:hypothetical protein
MCIFWILERYILYQLWFGVQRQHHVDLVAEVLFAKVWQLHSFAGEWMLGILDTRVLSCVSDFTTFWLRSLAGCNERWLWNLGIIRLVIDALQLSVVPNCAEEEIRMSCFDSLFWVERVFVVLLANFFEIRLGFTFIQSDFASWAGKLLVEGELAILEEDFAYVISVHVVAERRAIVVNLRVLHAFTDWITNLLIFGILSLVILQKLQMTTLIWASSSLPLLMHSVCNLINIYFYHL